MERFHRNFRPTGYLSSVLLAIFKKISSSHIWRPFWICEFFLKMEKHKFASIALTVRDRVILSKFSTHWLSKQCKLINQEKTILLIKTLEWRLKLTKKRESKCHKKHDRSTSPVPKHSEKVEVHQPPLRL